METIRSRAKDLLPSVLLTLLSIIQALALEFLWSRMMESPHLWEGGWPALLGWAQVSALFLGILEVWLFYTSLVMRFSWLPSIRDSIVPFVIGLLEFTLIELLGVEALAPWLCTLAAVFAVSTWVSHTIFVRARREPENREFFAAVRPATTRDFVPSLAVVGFLLSMALVVQVSQSRAWLALLSLLLANAALGLQIELTRRYWEWSMSRVSGEEAEA